MYAEGERTQFAAVHWWCLLAITLVALALRLYGLDRWSLWVDEAHTWRDATFPLQGNDSFLRSGRANYPLTFLALRGLLGLGLGQSEAGLRLPFALLGTLTVPLMGVCGRRLIGSWPAVVSAALLAVHPWHVFWSQNSRGYVVLVFGAVITIDRAFAYVRHGRWIDLLIVWMVIAISSASHTTGAVLAFGFVLFLIARKHPLTPQRSLRLALGAAVVLAAVLPLVKMLFPDFVRSKGYPAPLHFLQTTGFYFEPVALLMAGVGVWLLRHFGGRDRALLLGSFVLATFGSLFVVGSTLVLTTARYAISVLPVVVWLAAFAAVHVASALARWRDWQGKVRIAAVAVLPLLLFADHAIPLVDYYTVQHGQRGRWREAAEYLLAQAKGRPVRVSTVNHPTMIYYLLPGKWENRVPVQYARNRVVPLLDWMMASGQDEAKTPVCKPGIAGHFEWHRREAREQQALFAFVVSMPELAEQDRDGAVLAAIEKECDLVLYLPCWVGPKDESVYVYTFREP